MSEISTPPEEKTPGQIVADYDFLILKTGKSMKIDFYSAAWGQPFRDSSMD